MLMWGGIGPLFALYLIFVCRIQWYQPSIDGQEGGGLFWSGDASGSAPAGTCDAIANMKPRARCRALPRERS